MLMSRNLVLFCLSFFLLNSSQAALVGTEVVTSLAYPTVDDFITYDQTRIVSATEVEIPSLNDFQVSGVPYLAVDASIDFNNTYIDIDFDNAQTSQFTPATFNGYIFTFQSDIAVVFTSSTVDPLTTIGLLDSDLSFSGNQLFVNVESLFFNPTSFVRISLESTGGPPQIPLPAGIWLFGSGLLGLIGVARRKKAA